MGGTLTVQSGVMLLVLVHPACRVGRGRGGAAGWCTLLGPEGPGFLPHAREGGVGGGWAA